MKTLRINRKQIAAVFTVLALMLCACGQQAEPQRDWKAEAEAASVSCVSKEDCFLCGAGAGYFGQNNVGLVSLNTFAVMPLEINRYDRASGELIEENTGAMQMRFFQNCDDGMSASVMLEPDRGIAHVSISPKQDAALDLASAAAHLCPDCLAELAAQLRSSAGGVGIVNFATRRLYALQESVTGFGAGDYYVHFDRNAENGEISVLITYSPLRYDNEA